MLFDDNYYEIETESEGLFKDKGSKFIARAFPIYHEEEVKPILEKLRKEYYDARHHCYAYILNPDKSAYRTNDDGEPSGSAGKPIYGQLLSHDLTNIIVVVIRYFGGTKLGIPGLINAYKSATKDAIENTNIIKKTVKDVYSLKFEYPLMNVVMRFVKDEDLETIKNVFEISCYMEVAVRKSESERILEQMKNIYGLEIKYLNTI
jgi:uncharacterized YigZ family protein